MNVEELTSISLSIFDLLYLQSLSHAPSSTPSGVWTSLSRSDRAVSTDCFCMKFCLEVDGRSANGFPLLASSIGVSPRICNSLLPLNVQANEFNFV